MSDGYCPQPSSPPHPTPGPDGTIVLQPADFKVGDSIVFKPGGYRHLITAIGEPTYPGLSQVLYWVTFNNLRGTSEVRAFPNLNLYHIFRPTP